MKNQVEGFLRAFCLLIAMASLTFVARPVWAQSPANDALPTAQSLIERHLKAIGGKMALAKIKNRISTGTLLIKPMDVKGTVVMYESGSNKFYMRLTLDRVGKIERGSDGEVFWEKAERSGVRVMSDQEGRVMMALSRMDLVGYTVEFEKMQTAGEVTVDGEACYEVAMTPKGIDRPILFDFSKASGLNVRRVTTLSMQNEEVKVVKLIAEYQKADDVLVPRMSVEKAHDIETIITLTDVAQNVKINDNVFNQPKDTTGNATAESPSDNE